MLSSYSRYIVSKYFKRLHIRCDYAFGDVYGSCAGLKYRSRMHSMQTILFKFHYKCVQGIKDTDANVFDSLSVASSL